MMGGANRMSMAPAPSAALRQRLTEGPAAFSDAESRRVLYKLFTPEGHAAAP